MKQKTSALLFFLSFFFFFSAISQVTIRGKVLKKNDLEPLGGAAIFVPYTYAGTLSDSTGYFEIEIPQKFSQDSLFITFLGYKDLRFHIPEIKTGMKFHLESKAQSLQEVVVYPINADDLMDSVRKYLYANHYREPLIQTGFMRQAYFEKGQCLNVGEAVFDIYNFKNDKKEISFTKYRKARSISDSTALQFINAVFRRKKDTLQIGIGDFLGAASEFDILDKIDTSSNRKDGDEFLSTEFRYIGTKKYAGRSVHDMEIDFFRKKVKVFKAEVFVDTASYAVVAYNVRTNEEIDFYTEMVPWAIRTAIRIMGYKIYIGSINFEARFRKYDDKWLLDYGNFHYSGSVTKKKKTVSLHAISEFFVLKVEEPETYPDIDLLSNKVFEEDHLQEFTTDYWTPYPYLKLPKRYKTYIAEIRERNKTFEGSIAYSKKKKRKRKKKSGTDK